LKVIEPTPSQAAVAVQKLLKTHGIEIKLGLAQEAIAVSRGYASWNALASHIDPRGRNRSVKKQTDASKPANDGGSKQTGWDTSIRSFEDRSRATDSEAGAENLHFYLDDALTMTGLLDSWKRRTGRDECAMEEEGPFVQVSFDNDLSERFTTELVFTIRNHKLACYVRTWEIRDGLRPSRDYRIFMEQDGRFDTEAEASDEGLASLVLNALREAERHKRDLKSIVNVD